MKKKSKDSLKYILRITEFKDLHHVQKVRKPVLTRTKEKVRVKIIHPKTRETLRQYKTKVTAYKKTHYDKDTIRYSQVFYVDNVNEIEEILKRKSKEFRRSKKTNFTAISQLYQGKIQKRYTSKLKTGSKVTKPVRLISLDRKMGMTESISRINRFTDQIENISIDSATDIVLRTRRKKKTKKYKKRKRGKK